MADEISNDNDGARRHERLVGLDAHGQAAILLVESLIHGLVAKAALSVAESVEIVTAAIDVNQDLVDDGDVARSVTGKSLAILGAIRASLENDLPNSIGRR